MTQSFCYYFPFLGYKLNNNIYIAKNLDKTTDNQNKFTNGNIKFKEKI